MLSEDSFTAEPLKISQICKMIAQWIYKLLIRWIHTELTMQSLRFQISPDDRSTLVFILRGTTLLTMRPNESEREQVLLPLHMSYVWRPWPRTLKSVDSTVNTLLKKYSHYLRSCWPKSQAVKNINLFLAKYQQHIKRSNLCTPTIPISSMTTRAQSSRE